MKEEFGAHNNVLLIEATFRPKGGEDVRLAY